MTHPKAYYTFTTVAQNKSIGKFMGVLLQGWKNKLVDWTAFCLGNKQRDYLRILYAGATVECMVSRKQIYLLMISLPTLQDPLLHSSEGYSDIKQNVVNCIKCVCFRNADL